MLANGQLDRPGRSRFWRTGVTLAVLVVGGGSVYWYLQSRADSPGASQALVRRYCVDCHNSVDLTADLSFDHADFAHVGQKPDVWEKVVRKLRAGMMPPADR